MWTSFWLIKQSEIIQIAAKVEKTKSYLQKKYTLYIRQS